MPLLFSATEQDVCSMKEVLRGQLMICFDAEAIYRNRTGSQQLSRLAFGIYQGCSWEKFSDGHSRAIKERFAMFGVGDIRKHVLQSVGIDIRQAS